MSGQLQHADSPHVHAPGCGPLPPTPRPHPVLPVAPYWFSGATPVSPAGYILDSHWVGFNWLHAGAEFVPRKHDQCRVSENTSHPGIALQNKTYTVS